MSDFIRNCQTPKYLMTNVWMSVLSTCVLSAKNTFVPSSALLGNLLAKAYRNTTYSM